MSLEVFADEVRDRLESIEEVLLALRGGRREPHLIDELFRYVHTVKGSAAVVGLTGIADFTHGYENVLGRVRDGAVTISTDLITLLFSGLSHIENLLQISLDGDHACVSLAMESAKHTDHLRAYLGEEDPVEEDTLPAATEEFEGIFLFEDEPDEEADDEADDEDNTPTPTAPTKAAPQQQAPTARASTTLRVSSEGLDRLVNLIGELVTASARSCNQVLRSPDQALRQTIEHQARLLEDVRDVALGLRMLPVDTVFKRFRRMVYDVSAGLGKNVQLEIDGAETELDKTILDRIGDPLTHLVRNAIDHGIELPHERQESGKSTKATIKLVATQEYGSVVIEVADDGRGLNLSRIHARAVERGLIDPEEVSVDDPQVAELITLPGLSTHDKVTELSGRGVGMDAVKRNVEALSGSLSIRSWPGQGSRFTIRLPVTLSIIRGFVVRVAGSPFVIPVGRVEECISQPDDDDALTGLTVLRDQDLPFVRMRTAFGEPPTGGSFLVVVRSRGGAVGLLVDALEGESHAVVKTLGPLFTHQTVFNGATVLGSGEIALIVDVDELIQSCLSQHAEQVA